MAKANVTIGMIATLLNELESEKHITLSEFHYGENYKEIAELIYNTVSKLKRYPLSMQEFGTLTVVQLG